MSVIEFTPNGYPRFGGLRRDGPSALSKPGMNGCLGAFGEAEYKGMIPLRRSHKTVGPRSVEAGRFGADPHHVRLPTSEPSPKDEFPTFLI